MWIVRLALRRPNTTAIFCLLILILGYPLIGNKPSPRQMKQQVQFRAVRAHCSRYDRNCNSTQFTCIPSHEINKAVLRWFHSPGANRMLAPIWRTT